MSWLLAQADAARLPLADRSVDMVFGSPPYADARLYLEDGVDLGISRKAAEWVEWMLQVTAEALRVSRGMVLWVCAGVTRDRCYWPACEGLLWEGWKRGWLCECPCYWHRVGVFGSGGDQWFRKDVEYVLAFKSVEKLPWSHNTACGTPPKWKPGGDPSHRRKDGTRVNRDELLAAGLGKITKMRDTKSGEVREFRYVPPEVVNPGNYIAIEGEAASSVVEAIVGGGRLGHPAAHVNEAPFPEALAEFFIKSLCPPGGVCLDPFSGSGTTAAVCERLGRIGVGVDLRMSQCRLAKRRIERPHAPVPKRSAAREEAYELFD